MIIEEHAIAIVLLFAFLHDIFVVKNKFKTRRNEVGSSNIVFKINYKNVRIKMSIKSWMNYSSKKQKADSYWVL